MDIIKKFCKTNKITIDLIDLASHNTEKIVDILNGNILNLYSDPWLNVWAGIYHEINKNLGQAKKYYAIAGKTGNSYALNCLANIYNKWDNVILAERHYWRAIEAGSRAAIINLIELLFNIDGTEKEIEKNIKLADKYNCKYVDYYWGRYYILKEDFNAAEDAFKKAKEYRKSNTALGDLYLENSCVELGISYLMEEYKNDRYAANILGVHFYRIGEYITAEYYYNKALEDEPVCECSFEKCCVCAIDKAAIHNNLATLYSAQNRHDKLIQHRISAIAGDYEDALDDLVEDGIENTKLYNVLSKIKESCSLSDDSLKTVNDKMSELYKNYNVKCFANKLKLCSKMDKCPICLEENTLVIPRECAHYYCRDCYIELSKCAICD